MKLVKMMSLSAVVLGVALVGVNKVNAADEVKASTKATLEIIKEGDGEDHNPKEPEVVDPKDPKEPGVVDPEKTPGGSGEQGKKDFMINWVSNFQFGKVALNGTKAIEAYAGATFIDWAKMPGLVTGGKTENVANFLQVTDVNGQNAGWNVSVTATNFTSDEDATILKGAALYLQNAQVYSNKDNQSDAPIVKLDSNKNILQTTGASHTVISAGENTGIGNWTMTWGGEDASTGGNPGAHKGNGVKLVIPVGSGAKVGANYTSTLKWTLQNTPEN